MPRPNVDPDSFDKVNFVIDAWTTGCDAPWYIYIETMKPALLNAFITLITFGWDDVLRGFFRPKGLYKRRTMKRKGKFVRRIPRFPEVGNTIGKNLGGMTGIGAARWSNFGKFLWRVDGAMESVRFFWLVAAITEDFAFEWTSLLYESYWCQEDPPGRFSYSNFGLSVIPDNSWKLAGFAVEDYEHGPPTWGFLNGSSGPKGATVTAAMRCVKVPAFPMPTSFQVRVKSDSDATVYMESGANEEIIDGEIAAVTSGSIPPNTIFRVEARMTGTPWAEYGNGVVIGVETRE